MRSSASVTLLLVIALLVPASSARAGMTAQQKIALLRGLGPPRAQPTLEAPSRAPKASMAGEENCARNAWWRRSRSALRLRIEQSIQDAAVLVGVPTALVRSVIRVESNYDPDAVSHAGAEGLMQLMPATARELGVMCAFDPRENILAGTRYLKRMHQRFGSWRLALAAYNAGPARASSGRWPAETRHYVREVLRRYEARGGG